MFELAMLLEVDVSSIRAWINHPCPEQISRSCPWIGAAPVVRPNERTVLIAAAALRTDEAKRIDFDASPDLRPRRRTMGTGLPGYRSGWFRLQNGESALVYLTDSTRAVYIPTSEGYSVLVTPSDPDAFLAAVRRLGRP